MMLATSFSAVESFDFTSFRSVFTSSKFRSADTVIGPAVKVLVKITTAAVPIVTTVFFNYFSLFLRQIIACPSFLICRFLLFNRLLNFLCINSLNRLYHLKVTNLFRLYYNYVSNGYNLLTIVSGLGKEYLYTIYYCNKTMHIDA